MIQIPVEPKITEYLSNKAARLGIPLNGTFELTPCCNMNCRMCYVRLSKEEQEKRGRLRTAEEWLSLAEKARDQGMLYLLLTGGEPFLRTDIREIVQGLHKMGFVISMNTNATMINEQTVEWLKETPPVRLNITLYGASDETYERLCRNPKGFTQVTHAIHLLKEAGISVKINCSVTPYNAGDLEEIFAFCEREGLLVQASSYMFPPLRKDETMIGTNDRFTPEEASYYSAKILSLLNGKEKFIRTIQENRNTPMCSVPEDDCLDTQGEGIRCRAGKCSFWVTWNGTMMPCGMFASDGALNAFEDGFEEAWKKTRAISDGVVMPKKCTNCSLKEECRSCAAMSLTETGAFDQVPEYRCRMTQVHREQCERLMRELLEDDDETEQ